MILASHVCVCLSICQSVSVCEYLCPSGVNVFRIIYVCVCALFNTYYMILTYITKYITNTCK